MCSRGTPRLRQVRISVEHVTRLALTPHGSSWALFFWDVHVPLRTVRVYGGTSPSTPPAGLFRADALVHRLMTVGVVMKERASGSLKPNGAHHGSGPKCSKKTLLVQGVGFEFRVYSGLEVCPILRRQHIVNLAGGETGGKRGQTRGSASGYCRLMAACERLGSCACHADTLAQVQETRTERTNFSLPSLGSCVGRYEEAPHTRRRKCSYQLTDSTATACPRETVLEGFVLCRACVMCRCPEQRVGYGRGISNR